MKKMILESKLTKELKNKISKLFDCTEEYVSEHVQEAKGATIIYLPTEITFNKDDNKIVRVGLVNDLYFENSKDLNNLNVEFDNEEFNQFDENGVIEGLIPINLSNDKCIICMPAIYTPKDHNGDGEMVRFLEYKSFFN